MVVCCAVCTIDYDDTYRWTFCPHERFEMWCSVVRGDGETRVCTSVAELMDFLDEREPHGT